MASRSLMGASRPAMAARARSSDLLGPSDNSDSGSDAWGSSEARANSDASGSGERSSVDLEDAVDGADIGPDAVVEIGPDGKMREVQNGPRVDEGDGLEGFSAADWVSVDQDEGEPWEGDQ